MKDIQKYFKPYNDFLKKHNELVESFRKEFKITEDYMIPLSLHTSEIKYLTEKVKTRLLEFVIEKIQKEKCPNINVNEGDVITKHNKRFKDKISTDFVIGYITTKYLNKNKAISYQEILHKAQSLLPYWVNGKNVKDVELEELKKALIKKNCLTLNKHVTTYGGSSYLVSYSLHNTADLTAFEKLCKIVISGADPTTIQANRLSHEYWNRKEEGLFEPVFCYNGGIQKVKLFKNGKFKVWFTVSEYAPKVLGCLVKK